MKLHVHEEAGRVVNVSVRDVPPDFTHHEVRYAIACLATEGNALARKALPHMTAPMAIHKTEYSNARTFVYLDNG